MNAQDASTGRRYVIRDWLETHVFRTWWWRLLVVVAFVLFVIAAVFSDRQWYRRLAYALLAAWTAVCADHWGVLGAWAKRL